MNREQLCNIIIFNAIKIHTPNDKYRYLLFSLTIVTTKIYQILNETISDISSTSELFLHGL